MNKILIYLYLLFVPFLLETSSLNNRSFFIPLFLDQFKASGLSIFNNFWNSVHDFDSGTGSSHWCVVKREKVPAFHPPPPEVAGVGVAMGAEQSVVPCTVGASAGAMDEVCYALL